MHRLSYNPSKFAITNPKDAPAKNGAQIHEERVRRREKHTMISQRGGEEGNQRFGVRESPGSVDLLSGKRRLRYPDSSVSLILLFLFFFLIFMCLKLRESPSTFSLITTRFSAYLVSGKG